MDILVPSTDGHWISEAHSRIAEMINDYDPTMELVWIPPEDRHNSGNAAPYAVRHNPPGKMPYIMFFINEDELDHRVIGRIYAGDIAKTDVGAMIEANELAYTNLENRRKMEKALERQDFIKTVVGSHKHDFKHNGKIYPK